MSIFLNAARVWLRPHGEVARLCYSSLMMMTMLPLLSACLEEREGVVVAAVAGISVLPVGESARRQERSLVPSSQERVVAGTP